MYILEKEIKTSNTMHYLGKDFPRACKNPHGHEYLFKIRIGGNKLNQYDMLIDFQDIKTHCDDWIQQNWDHAAVFSSFQTELMDIWDKNGWKWTEFPIKDANTTSENMALFLANKFYKELKSLYPNIEFVEVGVYETRTSACYYRVDETNKQEF